MGTPGLSTVPSTESQGHHITANVQCIDPDPAITVPESLNNMIIALFPMLSIVMFETELFSCSAKQIIHRGK